MTIRNWLLLLSVSILSFTSSCKEDDPEPLKAETQAVLLAGSKGSSKSWKLSVATYQEASDPSVDFDLTPCILDNIYLFTNNDDQSYRCTDEVNYSDGALFSFLTYPSDILDLT